MQAHGSVITHLLSQVKIGMDLTKVYFLYCSFWPEGTKKPVR